VSFKVYARSTVFALWFYTFNINKEDLEFNIGINEVLCSAVGNAAVEMLRTVLFRQ
jgi:hypothetical protein